MRSSHVPRATLGLSALAAVLGLWAFLLVRQEPKPRHPRARGSIETYARTLTEPADGTMAWRLKRPYPSSDQVERALGKADEKSADYTWAVKYVWRSANGETVAWFSKADGLLDALELNYGGVESIARDPIHYRRETAHLK